jgi:hypothetical protein
MFSARTFSESPKTTTNNNQQRDRQTNQVPVLHYRTRATSPTVTCPSSLMSSGLYSA